MTPHTESGLNEEAPKVARTYAARGRIFVAAADDDARALIAAMLKLEGHDVVEAADGTGLVDALIKSLTGTPARAPDLVIMAAHLDGYTGIDVLRRLRRFDQHTPVIVLTEVGDDAAALEAEGLGASWVLRAPFDFSRLRCAALELLIP